MISVRMFERPRTGINHVEGLDYEADSYRVEGSALILTNGRAVRGYYRAEGPRRDIVIFPFPGTVFDIETFE